MSVNEFIDAFALFREPLAAGMLAGLALGALGVFIVLRRMVFLSAALAQSAGLGVAVAFWVQAATGFSLSPILTAAGFALAAGLLVSMDVERLHMTRDAVLALVYIAAGALAVIVGSRIAQDAHDIQGILFGSGVLVRTGDLAALAVGAVVTGLVLIVFWKGLVFSSFDAESARVQGLPVFFLQGVLFGLIVLMDSVAMRGLGMLPVFAFSTLPAVGALGFSRRLPWVVVLAAVLGALAGGGGYLAAFFWDLPVGAAQVMASVLAAVAGLGFRLLR